MSEPTPSSASLHKNETLKVESRYLRGTLREALDDHVNGGISADDAQIIKFHGSYIQDDRDIRNERRKKKLDKAYIFMIRIKATGGACTPEQWLAMDRLASEYGNGTLKLTTRQAFQLHGVIKSNLKRTMQEINRAVMTTVSACGDVNRNVMCTPNAHESTVHAEALQVANAISDHLAPRTRAYHEIWLDDEQVVGGDVEEEPIYGKTYLPRKFKTVIVVPPVNDVDVFAHDLGFIAHVEKGKLAGFTVTVGGGLGMTHGVADTFPRLADVLGYCRVDQAVEVAEKVVLVQKDYGDRTNRAHARLKYTIDDRGIDWFRQEVETRLGYKLGKPKRFEFTTRGDRYGWVRGTDNKWHLTLFIQNGRVIDTADYPMRTGLREIAKVHEGVFYLTNNQNLIISGISDEKRPQIDHLLNEYGLLRGLRSTGLRLNSIACVALPTCGLALAESERYLPDLLTELDEVVEEAGLRDDEIVIRMTGCPNGCGRPYLGEIGLVGKAPGKYNLYLGAGFSGERLARLYKDAVPAEELVAEIAPLLRRYAKERNDGERFGDFVIRAGIITPWKHGENYHLPSAVPQPV